MITDYSDYSDSDKNWIETNAVSVFIGEPVWEKIAPPSSPKVAKNGRRPWGSPVNSPGGPEQKKSR